MSLKKLRNFDVLRNVTVIPSKNGKSKVLQDEKGKIFFPDKKCQDNLSKFQLGDKLIVWVINEFFNFGYVRTRIEKKYITEYLSEISSLSKDFYWNAVSGEMTDTLLLSNYMYNNDIDYNDYMGKTNSQIYSDSQIHLLSMYDKYGITSEKDEACYELIMLFVYLHNKYNIINRS